MSGPTQRLPFLTAAEEASLRPGPSGRVGGVATAGDFFTLFLRNASEFAAEYHDSLGDRAYKEWPWEEDGQKQYEGSLRKVQFVSPVRNAPELSNETRVDEEQRWICRGHAHATLEVRRKLPDLRDGDRFVVVVRWVMTFDGFGCNLRVYCGTLFFKSSAYAKEIREGCVRGYAQSAKRWLLQAEKYSKNHSAVHLRPKVLDSDDAGEAGARGAVGEGKNGDGDAGGVGGGLSKSGRVPVLEAMRSSVGSSNSIQLAKCHAFLGEYIYLTEEIKRVVQGEQPGDLVLEEDLTTGGGGVGACDDGGLAEGQLESERGSKPSGDMENNTVTSHISHVSVESARTGSWSGSAVGGFGFVDYPAGIPHKQWGRVQDRTVRWLMRSDTASNASAHLAPNNRDCSSSVISGNFSIVSGSTTFSASARGNSMSTMLAAPSSPSKGAKGTGKAGTLPGEQHSPGAVSTREEDVVHAKWLEQLRLVSEKASKAAEAKDADADGRDNGDDLVGEEVKKKKEASTEGGDGVEPEEFTPANGDPTKETATTSPPSSADPHKVESGGAEGGRASASGEKPYTVVFHGRRLGIQLRELHDIPVVGGLQGYDPDGTGEDGADDGEEEEDDEGVEGLPVEVSPEPSAFDELSLARLVHYNGTAVHPGAGKADDLQTIYGGSGGRGGGATETSSHLDSQSDYQETVKCIVQCAQLFGEGVKKLWRWRPAGLPPLGEDGPEASVAVEAFMKGLGQRLGLGEDNPGLRVSYLDMDVGGGDGEYVSLDIEAWEDFLESRFKRLSVTIDPEALISSKTPPRTANADGIAPKKDTKFESEVEAETKAVVADPESSKPDSALLPDTDTPGEPGPAKSIPGNDAKGVSGGDTVENDHSSAKVANSEVQGAGAIALDAGVGTDNPEGRLSGSGEIRQEAEAVLSRRVSVDGVDAVLVKETVGEGDRVAGVRFVNSSGGGDDEGKSAGDALKGFLDDGDKAEVSSVGGEADEDVGASVVGDESTVLDVTEGLTRRADGGASPVAEVDSVGEKIVDQTTAGGGSSSSDNKDLSAVVAADAAGVDDDTESITSKMQALRGRLTRIVSSSGSVMRLAAASAGGVTAAGDSGGSNGVAGVVGEGKGERGSVPGARETNLVSGGSVVDGEGAGAGWSPQRDRSSVEDDDDDDEGEQRHRSREVKEMDSDENGTADLSAPSTSTSRTGKGAGKVARRPCVGSVLVSVNGVRTQGLSFANVVQLLNTRERPIVLEYIDNWDTIFHQHHMETQAREKISRETFEQKLRHPLAAKLRKKIEEWMSAFREQNLRAMVAEIQAEDEDADQTAKAMGPAVMLWSLIRWLEQELPDVGIFNNNHRAGGGLPVMGELQWKDVKQHLERHIFEQVFDRCLTSAPDYGLGDEDLTAKLASLRFLLPRHWCVDSLKDTDSTSSYGREWELAQGELCRLVEYRCPLDMLDCVRACVRLVALSVEASLARRQRELEEAAAAAERALAEREGRSGGSISSRSGRAQKVAFGADDLLAALTWVVVQANPPRLASRLWFTSYYMREGVEGLGEGAYCLTQLSSALEFARHAEASVLADITEDELNQGLETHAATQDMIKAATEGDSESVSYWLGAGADPNGLSSDQQATALTAAVSHRRRGVLKILLEGAGSGKVDPNTRVCPNYGVQRGRTALMVAATMGDMATSLALLRMPGVDRRLVCAHGKDAVDYAVQYGHMEVASVLLADPAKATLCQAAKAGNLAYVKALLLQGQDPNVTDSTGQYTPLIASAFLAHIEVLEALLACPLTDPDRPNVRGETPLMYCSQREGYASTESQVAAAVRLLGKGADRHLRDHEGRTAMEWARRFGSTRLLDVLLYDPNKVKIFLIAKERDVRGAMALLEQEVDPNTKCPERDYTPLIAAVFNQDEDMASALLSHHKTDVNRPGRHGMTPLMYAAQAGHERMAVLLLRLRADRYRCNDKGETALEISAVRGHMTVVNVLKYDPERLSICSAAANDDGPAIDGLLRQGVSVDSRHRQRTARGWHHERYTPLIAGCSQGHLGMVKHLLAAGADPKLPNLLGQTPLMYAAGFGTEELVLLLLAALKKAGGAGRKAVDNQGRTALRFAESAGHDEVACILKVDPAVCTLPEAAAAGRVHEVWALMRQGISGNEARVMVMRRLFESPRVADVPNLMVRANQYRSAFEPEEFALTPLATAAIFGQHRVVEALLADPEVKVDVRDALGRTALMQAARFGSEGCVLRLLRHGAGRFKKDRARKTASDLAISAGHLGIAGIVSADPKRVNVLEIAAQGRLILLKGLVKQDISLNYINTSNPYYSPLIAASANGREECVNVILQCPGVQVNRPNARGETALMHGAASGSLKIVRLLVQHGANPELRDRRNRHVEHWAYKRGHVHMVLVKLAVLSASETRDAETLER